MAIFLAGHPSYSRLDPRVTPPLGDTARAKAFAPNIGASLKAVHPSLAIFQREHLQTKVTLLDCRGRRFFLGLFIMAKIKPTLAFQDTAQIEANLEVFAAYLAELDVDLAAALTPLIADLSETPMKREDILDILMAALLGSGLIASR